MKSLGKMIVAIGSENKAKIRAAQLGFDQAFKECQVTIVGCKAASLVSDQPMSDEECIKGAINRAKESLIKVPEAKFGVGMEGGVNNIKDPVDKWYECGWIAVVSRDDPENIGIASTARFELPPKVMHEIIVNKKELAVIMDELTQQTDIRSNEGAMGVYTNSILHRDHIYSHGLIFALSRFITKPEYW
ncbi:hypothetical protein DICPUDRAFT_148581 [Dictyostelium purpureum]|uniref:inosine/xanthosine triphosphatase n=1 Tax=Dictyostelium purpureum TaxID=5786 RepID=F0ZBH4_DICPU|nr:uncharacterized protein DICPUDRAFT_148581 [Dictyostelium purpureum]EGC38667.1 hypothetical protein DICPUDRAFT_148581 [Dictyostelium purpureum]|eukprot:XP_003284763.1 hypothetical protein DICPUDRAFT_148581 [Dictyostelium purpureum]